ncbi:MAG: chromosome segregation protein SMC, partial [Desulfobacterales bacterium]|nr:chromosome segregation protein SMC [Desulfobacterales bacterium]
LNKLDAAVEEIKLQRERKNQEITEQKSRKFETRRNLDKIENDMVHLRDEVKRLARESEALKASQKELEGKNAAMASEIAQVEKESRGLEAEKHETQSALDKEREASRETRERAAALNAGLEKRKAKLLELAAQEARCKNIYQNASTNKENLQRRLKRIDEEAAIASKKAAALSREERKAKKELEQFRLELEELKGRIRLMEETLTDRREKLASQIKSVQSLELERNKARSKYTTLKKMEDSFEWYKDGVKALMKRAAAPDAPGKKWDGEGILGLAVDILEPEPSYETAVEAVLGDALQYILVKGQKTGVDAISYLQAEDAGRGGFIPVSSVRPMAGGASGAPDPGSRLLHHVKVKKGGEAAAEMLLGHVIVADDLDGALKIFNDNGHAWTAVSKEGDVVTHQGVLIGGSKGKLSGILEKKQEIKALEQYVAETDALLLTERERQKRLESEVRGFEVDLQKLMKSKNYAAQDEVDAEKELYKVTEDLKHARRHLEIVLLEQEQIQGEASDADAEMVKYNKALAEIEKEAREARDEVEKAAGEIRASASEIEALDRKVVDLKLKRTTLNARQESNDATLRRLKSFREDAVERFRLLSEDIEKKVQKGVDAEKKIKEYEQGLSVMYSNLDSLGGALESNEANYREIDARLKDSDEAMATLRDEREKTKEKLRLLEIEQSRRKMERENIANRLEERYHATIGEFKARMKEESEDGEAPSPDPARVAEMETELGKLKEKIAKITDVNLGAIKEYEQLKDRHDFLCKQKDDLVKAIEDLQKVIRKINRITQKRFLETFHQVNQKIKEVFPRLFEGGTAKLILTDPENPLETGVEYLIHPPGKKLTRMTLLSGGEKALSAIAFIFALFLLKPASFCILDEIDAPLDDANVFRFNNLLQLIGEKSQIVMITHNKNSMEFADTLFGITMEKKGISKVVSVNLDRGGQDASGAAAPGDATTEKEAEKE